MSSARTPAGTKAKQARRAVPSDIFSYLKFKNSKNFGNSVDPDNSTMSNKLDK